MSINVESPGDGAQPVALGADVDANAASAAYEDGMLIVELPLAPPSRPTTVRIEPERRDEP